MGNPRISEDYTRIQVVGCVYVKNVYRPSYTLYGLVLSPSPLSKNSRVNPDRVAFVTRSVVEDYYGNQTLAVGIDGTLSG